MLLSPIRQELGTAAITNFSRGCHSHYAPRTLVIRAHCTAPRFSVNLPPRSSAHQHTIITTPHTFGFQGYWTMRGGNRGGP